MKSENIISVVMPAYNCEKYIKTAIDSVLNQTYSKFELLIADDYSIDKTKKIIDSYSDNRIKTFHNEKNIGYLKTCNKLLLKAKGEYITFQDADDYSDPERFQKLINHFDKYSELSCIGSNIIKVSVDDEKFFTSSFPLSGQEIRNAFYNYKVVITGATLMIKKQVLEKVGVYNEYFDRVGSEDTHWFSHILNNFNVANIPDALYYYRANPNSVTLNHKNPKAFVVYQLIMHFYKNRLKGKKDYILEGNYKKADHCALYLMAINEVKKSKKDGLISFIKALFSDPILSFEFFREFAANYRAAIGKKSR